MGIFDSIANAEARNDGGKNSWFKDGEYIVEVRRHSYNPATRNGDTLAIVEVVIVEVLRKAFDAEGNPISNTKGESVAWFNKLNLHPITGEPTDAGKRGAERLKGYMVEVLGGRPAGVTEEMVTPKVVMSLLGTEDEKEAGEQTDVAGLKLYARAYTTVSKKTGKSFTNVNWKALSDEEDGE